MGRVLSVLGLSILVAISTVSSVSPSSMLGGTGVVRGTVTVTAVPAVDRPAVSALTGHTHDPADRQRAVVYLHTAPRQAFDDLRPGRVSMDQRGEQFVPRVLAITVGTTVEFPNNDRTFHNVFSLSRVRTFDLGRYRPGRTGRVTFDRPGEVPVFCDIHSHMSAYILVFSHPFFAVTGSDGSYTIANVPAGTYSLMVWSEVGRAPARRITVPEGGTAEADFRVGRTP